MQNARLDEAQAGIKIARVNINNLIYAGDNLLNSKKRKRTKEPLDEVKEKSEKSGFKLNIQKIRSWHSVPSFHGK